MAWAAGFRRGFGVEHEPISHRLERGGGGEILAARDRQRLDHALPGEAPDLGGAGGGLLAVELDPVRRDALSDHRQQRIAGINGDRHDIGLAPRQRRQWAGRFRGDVARAGREEHEADKARIARERRVDGFGCLEAADFDVSHLGLHFAWATAEFAVLS